MGKKQTSGSKVKESSPEKLSEQSEMPSEIDSSTADVLIRLRKVEGQIRGIQKMIEEGKNTADVVNQLAAIRKAINKAGIIMIANQLHSSITDTEISDKNKEKILDETTKQFLTLA